MQVKIEQHDNGEYYFLIPKQLQKELVWSIKTKGIWRSRSEGWIWSTRKWLFR